MSIKAIVINDSRDESLRILDAILGDRRTWVEVSPSELARQLGSSESTVRYNLKKFVKLGYLSPEGRGYIPTQKVKFLKPKEES